MTLLNEKLRSETTKQIQKPFWLDDSTNIVFPHLLNGHQESWSIYFSFILLHLKYRGHFEKKRHKDYLKSLNTWCEGFSLLGSKRHFGAKCGQSQIELDFSYFLEKKSDFMIYIQVDH